MRYSMSKYSVNFKSGLGPNPVFKGLFKVIKNGAVRWTIYAFNSNYGYILHQFRDKARYWSNFVIFHAPVRGGVTVGILSSRLVWEN